MVKEVSKGFKSSEVRAMVTSIVILVTAVFNSMMQIGIFNIPTVTYSVLAIFASSLVLWLFVAIDWPRSADKHIASTKDLITLFPFILHPHV